ncbi:PACE efflux transporter [Aestuariispira ectoiniformans]|uniref:PACE efflux transporter n=1 Tax=Aestuariispira ectoiniformans TaxID=2775080 RepID=UPI00223C2723|nr:PACE efflux transporter [Aestuariispira ectoiniformans]
MRTTKDRIRHAVSFEIIGLVVVTPLGGYVFDLPMHDIGMLAIIGASLATGWNYLYNLLFDRAMLRLAGHVHKTVTIRIFHAILFEGGLLVAFLPIVTWHLGVSLLDAFMMDISFALFYLAYAFVFNWAYDLVFPIPNLQTEAG